MPHRLAGQGAREIAAQIARDMRRAGKSEFEILDATLPWQLGARSEARVGAELARLPSSWVVRHDVIIGNNWNVDHIVIGPPGVFVLDTKRRGGQVKATTSAIEVDGEPDEMTAGVRLQALVVACGLKAILSRKTWVHAVLVFDNPVSGTPKADRVLVVRLPELLHRLTRPRRALSDAMVAQIASAIDKFDADTWRNVRTSPSKREFSSRAIDTAPRTGFFEWFLRLVFGTR